MKTLLIVVFSALVLSSCVSTSNLFQDGKTLGKDSVDVAFSATISQLPLYDDDDTINGPQIMKSRMMVPWLQFQGQYGLTNRLDVGGSVGVGIYSVGMQLFAKYALLPKQSKAGIALMALGGGAISNLPDEENDGTGVSYLNSLYAIPISVEVSRRASIVFQPMYGTERLALKSEDDNPATPNRVSKVYNSYRLGTGVIVTNKKGTKVHYNVTTAYYPDTEAIVPTFGVAIIPGR